MQREMSNTDNKKILKQTDLYEILPFKKLKYYNCYVRENYLL